MINREDLVSVGYFRKTHGKQGELTFSSSGVSFAPGEFLICEIDGIFVPFRITDCRPVSGSSAYIQLKNIDSEEKARELSHKEVFLHRKQLKEESGDDSFTWNYFIGFTLVDEKLGTIGRIVDVDCTTMNTLFIVERGDEEILIPAAEDFILRVDDNREEVIVALPEGLVEQ